MLYSRADNSAVSNDRAVRFTLLERAFRAANSANVDFSTYHWCPSECISIFDDVDKSAIFSTEINVPFTKMTGLLRPNLPEQPHSYKSS
jgi:hypothetical protein